MTAALPWLIAAAFLFVLAFCLLCAIRAACWVAGKAAAGRRARAGRRHAQALAAAPPAEKTWVSEWEDRRWQEITGKYERTFTPPARWHE
jgi:hypothetical protein